MFNSVDNHLIVKLIPLRGVHALCAQCTQACKQYMQVTVIFCPLFISNQQESVKRKKRGTLRAQQN